MAYTRFAGQGDAFGWYDGRRITLGGLRPDTDYRLICGQERHDIHSDARGAWSGQLLHDVPLCLARGEHPVLWDEARITAAQAALLTRKRETPPPTEKEPAPEPAEPEPEPAPEPEPTPEREPEAAPVIYRPASSGIPVDALPALQWPEGAAQLKQIFRENRPARLFDLPGFRTVRCREAGVDCCFGFRARDDRVCEVLYGVRARGGMVPPRGLQGYRYQRALDGSGYWVLRQLV